MNFEWIRSIRPIRPGAQESADLEFILSLTGKSAYHEFNLTTIVL